MKSDQLIAKHGLQPSQVLLDYITANFRQLGIHSPPAHLKNNELINFFLGEYYCLVVKALGDKAAEYLFQSRWNAYSHPDWFDHRISALSDMYNEDHVAISGVHTMLKIPLSGRVLSLCSGDGYYEYAYYSHRASQVDCIEISQDAFNHAVTYHAKENISYKNANILDEDLGESLYDVVTIRGAIEHFSEKNQKIIFEKANNALTENGYFCGDTVAKLPGVAVQLEEHECEWENEEEMKKALSAIFDHVETYSYVSKKRTTLLWSCKKNASHK